MRDEPGDYQAMSKWLSDPRVLEFHEGRDHPLALEQIESEYAPRIRGEEDVTPCLIILQSVPIGYMQFYLVGEESRNSYGLPADECLEAVYGIDQFIGENFVLESRLGHTIDFVAAAVSVSGQGRAQGYS